MRKFFCCFVGMAFCMGWMFGSAVHAQGNEVSQVGSIDFFGGQGMDTSELLQKLPVRIGQSVNEDQVEQLQSAITAAVLAATGKAATDVAVICCDQPEKLQFYVGLQGSSYRALTYAAVPTGDAVLPNDGAALYRKDSDALEHAVESGNSQEDDATGYALAKDPALHAIELTMRAYALKHTEAIERVLQESHDAGQRQAAATLLGYCERSPEQIRDLAAAANDADEDVRNNALRALGVLAATQPLVGLDVKPFVAMLYSGKWTDRNKASLLLSRLTEPRDPALLRVLRDQAMGPLLDGAHWQSPGHAYFFLVILGRIGGIDDVRLEKLIQSGARDEIIAAAEKH